MLDSSFIEKKLDHYFSFTSRNENFLDQRVYLFYLKSLQSKNVILLYDFINFMNFGDGQFWFYEIIVCNILVEPPLPLGNSKDWIFWNFETSLGVSK